MSSERQEENPYRNITIQRGTGHIVHNSAEETGIDEDPALVSLRRKLLRVVEDLEEIYAVGLAAKTSPDKVQRFLTMHSTTSKELYNKFNSLFDDLTDMLGTSDVSEQDKTMRQDIKDIYFSMCLIVEELKPTSGPTSTSTVGTPDHSRVKLPTLELINFDGQRTKWKQFKDTFESLVIKNPGITDIDRYHYLVTTLKGPANAIIAQLPVTADNFSVAWQALIDAYDNPRVLATVYLEQLVDIRLLTNKPSDEQLSQTTDKIAESIAAFKKVDIEDRAEFILFYLARRCLDKSTRTAFELQHDVSRFPTSGDLIKFLRHRARANELAASSKVTHSNPEFRPSPPRPKRVNNYYFKDRTSLMATPQSSDQRNIPSTSKHCSETPKSVARSSAFSSPIPACPVCTDRHSLSRCPKFNNMTVDQRRTALDKWKGCLNCLFPSHVTSKCRARGKCKFCQSSGHHTLLHKDHFTTTSKGSPPNHNSTTGQSYCATQPRVSHVMLGTAMCFIKDNQDNLHSIRLAMDSGSQFSFLTCEAAQRLGLSVRKSDIQIMGIGQTPFLGFKGRTHCKLVSSTKLFEVCTTALVVDTIATSIPTTPVQLGDYTGYELADPFYGDPRPVDFLLGADLFTEILHGEVVSFQPGVPNLIGTIFGYVVMGRVTDLAEVHQFQALCATAKNLSSDRLALLEDLEKLWEVEQLDTPLADLADPNDTACEEYFCQTHYRLPTGRYVVRLPFKGTRPQLPNNKGIAMKRLAGIEYRLLKDSKLKCLYQTFMQEYMELGHMVKATEKGAYVIPHHGILKESGDNWKIRVVFDASSPTRLGCLNDYLHKGPKLQNNIAHILLNFRIHNIVFTVDLVKMFRQILIHPEDRTYQHVLWRSSPEQPVEEYELCTVTYGQAPAPYLAIRSVHQLVRDEREAFPLAARVIMEDMYVDDIATGAGTLEEAVEIQDQLIKIFSRGEFPLSKWSSNHPRLLDIVEGSERNHSSEPRTMEDPDSTNRIKILGLQWDPVEDVFQYTVQSPPLVYTKRAILAAISRIYDPLGLLTPLIISAKLLIQQSWKLRLSWDEILPESLQHKWSSFVTQLASIAGLRIPRWVCIGIHPTYELLIFGDASEAAYCAAAYLRVKEGTSVCVNLLTSKAKLAPIKTMSIPRLELCAALLVVRLVETVFKFCTRLTEFPRIHLFTDSTVVLGWLNTPPHQLKTFVANRVIRILERSTVHQWSHVRSEDNPSDLGSRGLEAKHLIGNTFWFNGPEWALLEPDQWPVTHHSKMHYTPDSLPEQKRVSEVLVATHETSDFLEHFTACSSYDKLISRIARVLRFITNCRLPPPQRHSGPLTAEEFQCALTRCIQITQAHTFNGGKDITCSTRLRGLQALTPFLDEAGLLRVGGRTSKGNLPYSIRHPCILSAQSHLAMLIVGHYHRCLLHAGPSLTLSIIRKKFWIIRGRNLVRQYIRKCLHCRRLREKPCQPLMGNLPIERLQGDRPFLNVGIDFAGPFVIRDSLRRKASTSKAYMCIFICLGSKAIHLEAVSSMSTPAFLATLSRFVSRRGCPKLIWSDNGTNFVGSANTLREWSEWFSGEETQTAINRHTMKQEITWRFTPPHAPHFGGIWEAGVRSAKRLIRSAYGEGMFTYEELSTLFTKVEALLNSRPICPITNDPEELDALTPGHLLIGDALVDITEPSLVDIKSSYLDRWQLVIQRTQWFWKRWKQECLHELQQRTKWRKTQRNLAVGDLVLVQGESSDRMTWPLGRITEVFPGNDNVVRVVMVRTAKGLFRRPATKLIPLIEAIEDHSCS